jgi:alkylhydroperoxidase family enzyme
VHAHLLFLQAAGMPSRTVRALEQQPKQAILEKDLRLLITLAVRITECPASVELSELALTRAAFSWREYLDAVGVMVAFNFVNRVANALGVELEFSPYLRRFQWVRFLLMRLESLVLRALVDLRPRSLAIRPALENLQRMDALLRTVGFGPLPEFFHRLGDAPHLLEVQHDLFSEALKSQRGDLSTFMSVGVVVLDEVPAPELRKAVANWFRLPERSNSQQILQSARDGTFVGLPSRERTVLRFARDITCYSEQINRNRVDELRGCGFTDVEILDLVILTALWNAAGRLEMLLRASPESHREGKLNGGNNRREEGWLVSF